MRNASVLIINFKGLTTEVTKNLVLSGIGSLTILEEGVVDEEDLLSGFFWRNEEVGKKVSR
jgi:ubiquitin-like 1-activating enzyme E1 A